MSRNRYRYAAETFGKALAAVRAPRSGTGRRNYAQAFFECELGLDSIDASLLDAGVLEMVRRVRTIVDSKGFDASPEEGTASAKADSLSAAEKEEFVHLIGQLEAVFRVKAKTNP